MAAFSLMVQKQAKQRQRCIAPPYVWLQWTELISLFHPPKMAICWDFPGTHYTAAAFLHGWTSNEVFLNSMNRFFKEMGIIQMNL
jgi:hypothetical protein